MMLEMVLPRYAAGRGKPPPASLPGASAEGKATWLGTRVLIVEDEMMIAWMIESLLADAGFSDIVVAADGEEACRLASQAAPGIVVSDINLGAGADGIEAAVAICRDGDIPVLFVTAYADASARTRVAEHFPAAELLRKPVDRTALIAAVTRALGTPH